VQRSTQPVARILSSAAVHSVVGMILLPAAVYTPLHADRPLVGSGESATPGIRLKPDSTYLIDSVERCELRAVLR